ncbi:MAG: CYTH domain-containing protein [Muribaculaceae bacterium]|nr:CYTH domain-containing protein [Muribaculaceae bacterium]
MAKEIERKFLVKDRSYAEMATESRPIKQAYLSVAPAPTVRIRVSGLKAWITIKSLNKGAVRDEWEYYIPLDEAEEMAASLAGGWSIDKVRYIVEYKGWRWEIDEFKGRLDGLTVAEVEMPSATANPPLPPFIGVEVTGDERYYNSSLAAAESVPHPL